MIAAMLSDGRVLNSTVTATGTMLVIPANSMFTGDAFISAAMTIAGSGRPRIEISGTGGSPQDGAVIHQLSVTGIALATVASSGTIEILVKTGVNPVTISFNSGGASSASATINGFLI